MPFDIVVITHILNEHLIEQMLREIDRLETLQISLSVFNASLGIYRGNSLRSPCICLSEFHESSYPGT